VKADEEIMGEAIRIEFSEQDGKMFLVFEIIGEKQKQFVKKTWTQNIEYKIINKSLVLNE
jgi:hypothetical protein